ncbi:MAG: UDP-N-acetylmuramoyl-tripeptide--D-alanyl-D-alanine ligase [Candidatus Xenobia bacterium]
MSLWSLDQVARATGGTLTPFSGLELTGISTDTRSLVPGNLFVPLVGPDYDGHDFVEKAFEAGAAATLWARPGEPGRRPAVQVADTLAAYQDLARFHRRRLAIPVVAVTGSAGKTTTKELCAAVLGSRFEVHKTAKNYNNEVGVPRTLLELEPSHQVAVVEMAMRGAGQIRQLARLADTRVALISSIGEAHIELLGSREAICDAKGELLEELGPGATAVLPAECEFFERLKSRTRCEVLSFAVEGPADVRAVQLESRGVLGWRLEVDCLGRRSELEFPAPGRHNLSNLMGVLAVAAIFGVTPEEAAPAIAAFRGAELRMEVRQLEAGVVLLNDSYNASPAAMEGALEVLGSATGRRLAVLGDMLELGSFAPELHRRVGEAARRQKLDVLVAVGEESRALAEAARGGSGEVHWAPDREQAWELLRPRLSPGDTVLVKASRGMGLDWVAQRLQEVPLPLS